MTIVATTIIHPNQGVAWDDIHKQLKRAMDLAKKHGAQNATALVNVVGGQGTNSLGLLSTADDWASYGQIQQSLTADPDYQGLLVDAGQLATWENYVSQTIDV
ncbi:MULTISPECIES: hypothetical protein [unclassified Mycobacterium]|uniref:hypothetical protein n=1 Tax=unclassified Mycobacterium TaxID=2642494 RepID=UPI000801DE2C|nr:MULTISPECIES: hypothetical protein [unclassified Mycobacterium]OBG75461.1 hypothetical protein A5700_24455 [Mycobacterium sp. E1214]OBH31290.1 hypothetical protein A5693_16560 [Mycobacterium sp. E1319]